MSLRETFGRSLQRTRTFAGRCTNGTKGVISLFLVMVMLPFLSVALILVESARYQHAVELMTELMDFAGLSALADYDAYLEERFGLLAMSQARLPGDNYSRYLAKNMPALQHSVALTSSNAVGVYPLSETGVLKQQLLEYSEGVVAIEALYDGLDLDELLKSLYEKMGLKGFNELMDATSKTADVAASVTDMATAIKDAITAYNEYSKALSEYNAAAADFKAKAGELISALETKEENQEESGNAATGAIVSLYDTIASMKEATDLKTARDKYKTEAGEMASAVTKMKSALEKVFSTAEKITKDMDSAKSSMDKLSGTTALDQCTQSTGEWILEFAGELTHELNIAVKSTYSEDMKKQADLLNAQKAKLGKVVWDKAPASDEYQISASSDAEQVGRDFATVSLDSVPANFGSNMQAMMDELDSGDSGVSTQGQYDLGRMLDLAGELLGLSVFWDGALDANVSAASVYAPTSMSFSSKAVITSLTTVVSAGKDFVEALSDGSLWDALKAVAEFLLGIVEFFAAIIAWVGEFIGGVVSLIANIQDAYDKFLLCSYGVYNMPCRTTYTGKSVGGYSYSKIFDMQGGTYGNKVTGTLNDLKTLTALPGSGGDSGFRGAETEYLLIGSNNELLNQSAAFFDLYLLRMILNLGPIFQNKQVKAEAAAATVAGWVVYLAIIVAEPMLDAIMLVNGQSEYLLKDQIYLTPGGLILLAETIPSLTNLSGGVQADIKDTLVAHNGLAKASGKMKMSYQEHMLVLLMLMTSQDEFLIRMQNLIQMEARKAHELEYEFSLNQANTYVMVTADGTLNSMFDMEMLTRNGPFAIHRTRYLGY